MLVYFLKINFIFNIYLLDLNINKKNNNKK